MTIILQNNSIKNFNAKISKIKKLDLSNNNIRSKGEKNSELEIPKTLEILDLSENLFEQIPNSFKTAIPILKSFNFSLQNEFNFNESAVEFFSSIEILELHFPKLDRFCIKPNFDQTEPEFAIKNLKIFNPCASFVKKLNFRSLEVLTFAYNDPCTCENFEISFIPDLENLQNIKFQNQIPFPEKNWKNSEKILMLKFSLVNSKFLKRIELDGNFILCDSTITNLPIGIQIISFQKFPMQNLPKSVETLKNRPEFLIKIGKVGCDCNLLRTLKWLKRQ